MNQDSKYKNETKNKQTGMGGAHSGSRCRQISEFEASLICRVRSRTSRPTQKDQGLALSTDTVRYIDTVNKLLKELFSRPWFSKYSFPLQKSGTPLGSKKMIYLDILKKTVTNQNPSDHKVSNLKNNNNGQ